jgi:hypothetical protein
MRKGKRSLRRWLILLGAVVLLVGGYFIFRGVTAETRVSSQVLPCRANDDVTVFGEDVLYYDSSVIYCLRGGGGIKWSFPVGANARFAASDTNLVIWNGAQLYIVDRNGHASYNETMESSVQFARIGSKYCAVVIGEDTEPTLLIKNLDGTQADFEREEYSGMFLLDAGFYGDSDQYLWTLAYDYYGVAINTVLNTYQVGKTNTGKVNLTSFLAYKVLWGSNSLRVITTQQMYKYDYRAVLDNAGTQLVYGWQYEGSETDRRGNLNILMVRTAEINGADRRLTTLRVYRGDNTPEPYHLPVPCVGAGIWNGTVYAFAEDRLYHTDSPSKAFKAELIPDLPDGKILSSLIGVTKAGRAVVACTDGSVLSIVLPK